VTEHRITEHRPTNRHPIPSDACRRPLGYPQGGCGAVGTSELADARRSGTGVRAQSGRHKADRRVGSHRMARNSFLSPVYHGAFNSPISLCRFLAVAGKILPSASNADRTAGDSFGGLSWDFRGGSRGCRGGPKGCRRGAPPHGSGIERTFLASTPKKSPFFSTPKKPKKSAVDGLTFANFCRRTGAEGR
jgi:hypothetical protein